MIKLDELETLQHLAHFSGDRMLFERLLNGLSNLKPSELNSEKAQLMRADCYYSLERWEDLSRFCKCLIERSGTRNKEFWFGYAHALARLERLEEAYAILAKGAELWPDCPRIQVFRALLTFGLGNIEKARLELDRYYLEFEPEDVSEHYASSLEREFRKGAERNPKE